MEWLPFPQYRPKIDGIYLVTILGFGTRIVAQASFTKNDDYQWKDFHGNISESSITAFMDMPMSYIEKY
jgi:hypothetical protein